MNPTTLDFRLIAFNRAVKCDRARRDLRDAIEATMEGVGASKELMDLANQVIARLGFEAKVMVEWPFPEESGAGLELLDQWLETRKESK